MKNILLFTLLIMGISTGAMAQSYDSAIGVRIGYPNSISYKTFITNYTAVEIYGGIRKYNDYTQFNATAAYLLHNDIQEVDNLSWYYGAGAGVALYSYKTNVEEEGSLALSVLGFIGLEYVLEDTPLAFTIDYVPGLFLGGPKSGLNFDAANLGIRYILNR